MFHRFFELWIEIGLVPRVRPRYPLAMPMSTDALTVPLLDLALQNEPFADELKAAFAEVLGSGAFVLGPYVERFEQELSASLGCRHAIGVTSGTDAILLALMAAGVGPGDEVITTPFTWFSTASCVSRLGAIPVFVDINPRTYCLESRDIEGKITPKTKAILPVHLYGLSASMNRINEVAKKHGIPVIEDAAQAIGATYHGRNVGTVGDVGCFSFYPTKNLGAFGDAGAVVTNDDDLAHKMRLLRNHGMDPDGPTGFDFSAIGGNFRMGGIQAALLSVKLPRLAAWTAARREKAAIYSAALENEPVSTPFEPPTRGHAYHQYTLRVRGHSRDALMHHLAACHVSTRVFYAKPIHLQPCYASLGYEAKTLPESVKAADEVLSLPVSPEMTEAQQNHVIESIRSFFRAE